MAKPFSNEKRGKSRIAACLVFILLVVFLAVTLSSCKIFASEIVLKTLDITVDLGADGKTVFTETSEAKFTAQDTNWWNFYRIIDDETLLTRMSEDSDAFAINASSFTVDGESVEFIGAVDLDAEAQISKYQHSSKSYGYYYVRPSGVEIGVIMPEFSHGTHTISYSYSVKGIVTGIADASVFYYQYLSEINTMDVEKMSVKVNFPKAETDLRSWLHAFGNSRKTRSRWRSPSKMSRRANTWKAECSSRREGIPFCARTAS